MGNYLLDSLLLKFVKVLFFFLQIESLKSLLLYYIYYRYPIYPLIVSEAYGKLTFGTRKLKLNVVVVIQTDESKT